MFKLVILLHIICLGYNVAIAQHPSLSLTKNGVELIKRGMEDAPLFKQVLENTKLEVDLQLDSGEVPIPVPKDMAGGYTHEQHKKNYNLMHKSGILYQITGEEKYAALVKNMLIRYAEMYPMLSLHPTNKSYATGKIFWQCLNDANWLVFTSQAYDCIYDYLSAEERSFLERDLFIPFANFLSIDNPNFFNRIHNHSTWANAAVGMIALVMKNDSLLHKALYGLQDDGIDKNEVDNDGGFIKNGNTKKAGFLAQLDYSFSPDGYFAEGPYYLRYAIFPFLKFGQALHNNNPELDIFNYRDGILAKATNTALQLTDPQGQFFPINDAQKGMNYKSFELITAVDLMYYIDKSNKDLLNWAALQGTVSLDLFGFTTAKALNTWDATIPKKKSKLFHDGVSGKEGGVSVLRTSELELLFKFSTQGMGHGHFDRLSYSLYDNAGEVLQDYGAVRWVNVDQKGGGRYLPVNKTFGKQSIGHNALVVNESSHFNGSVRKAEKTHPELYAADIGDQDVQMISAIEDYAYAETKLHRTLFLIKDESLRKPIVLDFMKFKSEKSVTVDMPLWYTGAVMRSSVDCTKELTSLSTLGTKNGYQHIWKEGESKVNASSFSFNWFGNDRFYTFHAVSDKEDQILMGRLGANDPNFDLRSDPVMIHRKNNLHDHVFFNIIEPHGTYDRSTEIPIGPYGSIESLKVLFQSNEYVLASFSTSNTTWEICLSINNTDKTKNHTVEYGGKSYNWNGIYNLKKYISK